MKQIHVPGPITCLDPVTQEPVVDGGGNFTRAFGRYAIDFWLCDARMAEAVGNQSKLDAQDRLYNVLLPLFRNAKEGPLQIEDADYDKLLPIVKAPTFGVQNPLYAAQFLPFHRAVENATPCPP